MSARDVPRIQSNIMTFFNELFQLAQSAALTLTITANDSDGRMTINVVPRPKGDIKEAALATPLSLTATPDEFDAGFLEILQRYTHTRQTLVEQAAATHEVLEAATKASATKSAKAVAKAAPARSAATPTSGATDGDGDDESGDDDAGSPAPITPSVKAPAGAPSDTEPQLFG